MSRRAQKQRPLELGFPLLCDNACAWLEVANDFSRHRTPRVEAVSGRPLLPVGVVRVWSPQQYIRDGRALGISNEILEAAVENIERLVNTNPKLPTILTLGHLAKRTGVSLKTLRSIVGRKLDAYSSFRIRKRTGGHRQIRVPSAELMRVQRWLATYVLSMLPAHHCCHSFMPGSSILRCASLHVGARWLIKLDIQGFFESISEVQVWHVFRDAGYQPLVAFELTRLSTYAPPPSSPRYDLEHWQVWKPNKELEAYRCDRLGYLPQGAPTSPMISNLVMRAIDEEIYEIAKQAGLRFTRYADDMTFSTDESSFTRIKALRLVNKVSRVLMGHGLYINVKKTKIVPPGARKIVLGLIVDGEVPRLTREFRSLLRQHIFYLEKFGPAAHAEKRKFDTISGMHRHIRGLIDFANMVEPMYAAKMRDRFSSIDWSLEQ